ncbi:unnamed protein product, partial [Urochloa humidicola]
TRSFFPTLQERKPECPPRPASAAVFASEIRLIPHRARKRRQHQWRAIAESLTRPTIPPIPIAISPSTARSPLSTTVARALTSSSDSSVKMNSSNTQSEGSAPSVPKNPAMASCRKKKTDDDVTFLEDLKDHIDEFIHASMDEHKTCFKKTIQKMFGMSKAVAERSAAEAKEAEVESVLPLQTSVSQ